jgi:hypothetical protein
MLQVFKLAVLSAALSAALVAAIEAKLPPQSAGQFLIEHIERQVPQGRVQESDGCGGRAWPYRDGCFGPSSEGATQRAVRIIGIDRFQDATSLRTAQRSHMAER